MPGPGCSGDRYGRTGELIVLTGDTGARPGLPYFEQQDDDGHQVGEVARQPEDVHPA